MKVDLSGAAARLQSGRSFLVTSHVNPDGDAIGTMLAVYHLLGAFGKTDVTCVSHDPVPQLYTWLPGASGIRQPASLLGRRWDLAVVVDVAKFDRIGGVDKAIQFADEVLVLDHHLERSPEGTAWFIDPSYAACSEIIVDLFTQTSTPISREAAVCAYVGLITDTGGFRFSNTNAASHRRAAALLDAGVDPHAVTMRVFDDLPLTKFELLRRVLNHMAIGDSGRYAYTFLTQADMKEAKATQEDLDGLVNYARNLHGVDVGLLFRETHDGKVKVSVRSNTRVNSAELMQGFGGGGHAGAAGATLELELDAAMRAVLDTVRATLNSSAAGVRA